MSEIEFKRTGVTVKEIASKLNILIERYVATEGLQKFLKKCEVSVQVDLQRNGKKIGFERINIDMYRIEVVEFCSTSNDINMRDYCKVLSSFVSDMELEAQLSARYLPDYLTMKNIFTILLYEVPRKVKKSDLELLNKLYKKYNVKF